MNSFASTAEVNPTGSSPILTVEQLWKGLGIKARQPASFVPMITACEIVKDDGNSVSFISIASIREHCLMIMYY